MKALIIFLGLVVMGCVTSGVKAHAVEKASGEVCNSENYRDFINKEGIHFCNLQKVDLAYKASLRGANLRGADLFNKDLRNLDLRGADLRGANLRWTDLRRAYLVEADLRGTNLQMAYLRGAVFYDADLRGADLQGADLTDAKVTTEQAEYLKSRGFSGFVVVEYNERNNTPPHYKTYGELIDDGLLEQYNNR